MKQFFKRNLYKVALIVTLMAIATVAVTAGTFAALSAEYTWNSDETKAGEFAYVDTAYDFTLFNQETILPGNSGSGSLDNVPDFSGVSVVWEFAETNEDAIPMVYYFLDNEGNPVSIYSAYDFATVCVGKYIKLSDKYMSCDNVSNEESALVAGFATSQTVYWAWPSVVYEDAEGTETAAVAAYDEYNANLCALEYLFPNAITTTLNSSTLVPYAAKNIDDGVYTVESNNVPLTVKDGHIKFNNAFFSVYSNGIFKNTDATSKYKANDCVIFFVDKNNVTSLESAVAAAGINCVVDKTTKYGISSDTATVDANGSYYLAKLYPDAVSGDRPTVSVQIKATVTQA